MVEGIVIGFSDMLSIAQTVGIVGTMVLTFFLEANTKSVNLYTNYRSFKGSRVESYDSWRNSSS